MRTFNRNGLYSFFYIMISLIVSNATLAAKGDPFSATGKDLLDPKTGLAIKTKAGKQTKNLPANPEQLPATGANWSLELQYCTLYLQNDLQRFEQLFKQKGAGENDIAHALTTLESSIYPAKLRTEDKKGWATEGWIFVQDCRRDALVARKALRDYWKAWTPEKKVAQEVVATRTEDSPAESTETTTKFDKKVIKLEKELGLLKKAICQAFNPIVSETPLTEKAPAALEKETDEDEAVAPTVAETKPTKKGTDRPAPTASARRAARIPAPPAPVAAPKSARALAPVSKPVPTPSPSVRSSRTSDRPTPAAKAEATPVQPSASTTNRRRATVDRSALDALRGRQKNPSSSSATEEDGLGGID